MTVRDRYLAVLEFDQSVAPPLWEMGYWGVTITRWSENEGFEFRGDIPPGRLPGKYVHGVPVLAGPSAQQQAAELHPLL